MNIALHRVLTSTWDVISTRGKIVAIMNILFFGGVFVTVLLVGSLFPPSLYLGWQPDAPEVFLNLDWPIMIEWIFLFNLVVSAFVMISLLGAIFFPLSVMSLLYRAFFWGLSIHALPNWLFWALLPVLIFEGEAYALAAVAGSVTGLSWVKPSWLYSETELSRTDSFRKACRESLKLYLIIILLLLVATIVETAAILAYYR